ncbi:ANPRA protein, partial [Oxyruncus cristatus]|nr:ANPRA protein [Oxyruncus cristatus]
PAEIIERVKSRERPSFRPSANVGGQLEELGQLMQLCWAEDALERPDFNHIKVQLRKFNRESSSNILDNLLSRMEQYANNLEELVEERTQAYLEISLRLEKPPRIILCPPGPRPHLGPSQITQCHILGHLQGWGPQTSLGSPCQGLTTLSRQECPCCPLVSPMSPGVPSHPRCPLSPRCPLVETIGDAYMVVSGLPQRNGRLHAPEVARMALALLEAVRSFRIRHRPQQRLELRIGIHTG